jgi:hypothetical protein
VRLQIGVPIIEMARPRGPAIHISAEAWTSTERLSAAYELLLRNLFNPSRRTGVGRWPERVKGSEIWSARKKFSRAQRFQLVLGTDLKSSRYLRSRLGGLTMPNEAVAAELAEPVSDERCLALLIILIGAEFAALIGLLVWMF